MTYFKNHQWQVTRDGIESIDSDPYYVDIERLIDMRKHGNGFIYDLPSHMAEKQWVDLEAFIEAWLEAISTHARRLSVPFDEKLLADSLHNARGQ